MTHRERYERRKQIAEYLQEHNIKETIEKFEISYYLIRKCIIEHGIKKLHGNSNAINYKIIGLIINTDFSYGKISQIAKCSKQNVHQIANKMRDAYIKFKERSI